MLWGELCRETQCLAHRVSGENRPGLLQRRAYDFSAGRASNLLRYCIGDPAERIATDRDHDDARVDIMFSLRHDFSRDHLTVAALVADDHQLARPSGRIDADVSAYQKLRF